jgi:hypothetical protein
MTSTEVLWRCPFYLLPSSLRVMFLVQENAHLRWEERVRSGIPGSPLDDWLWAERFVNFTWPHLIISSMSPLLEGEWAKRNP